MKRLEVDQHSIEHLFTGHNGVFSIPSYQRPYSWQEDQCAELWYDLNFFAFPDGRADKFSPRDDFYFLGNMVVYPNDKQQLEVVDGQQRIISLLLLMRALYEELRESENGRQLGKCIWVFDEDGTLDPTVARVETKAIMESGKSSLRHVLSSGNPPRNDQSAFAENYRYFRAKIAEFKTKTPDNLEKLAARLLRNVYVTCMSANSKDQALQLFLTINDRGMALRIENIFQAKLFEDAKARGGDEEAYAFLGRWESLGIRCAKVFDGDKILSPIEFAFLLYAQSQNDKTTGKNLKTVYGANDYALLRSNQTLKSINALLDFFLTLHTVRRSELDCGNDEIWQNAHIMFRCNKVAAWHALAVYFFSNGKTGDDLYDEKFNSYMRRIIAYWVRSAIVGESYFATQPRNLRDVARRFLTGVPERVKVSEALIKHNLAHLFDLKALDRVQKMLLSWWTFRDKNQPRIQWNAKVEIEHIFAKALVGCREFGDPNNVELLGNLALLERTYNRKATNCTFIDKRKNYRQSFNEELKHMAQDREDFDEGDIVARNQQMIAAVIAFLKQEGFLLQ